MLTLIFKNWQMIFFNYRNTHTSVFLSQYRFNLIFRFLLTTALLQLSQSIPWFYMNHKDNIRNRFIKTFTKGLNTNIKKIITSNRQKKCYAINKKNSKCLRDNLRLILQTKANICFITRRCSIYLYLLHTAYTIPKLCPFWTFYWFPFIRYSLFMNEI